MADSGLQEFLEVVYAGNAVRHMLTGKAVSRAVRGHMLVDAALNTILAAKAYNVTTPTTEVNVEHAGMTDNIQVPASMDAGVEVERIANSFRVPTAVDRDVNLDRMIENVHMRVVEVDEAEKMVHCIQMPTTTEGDVDPASGDTLDIDIDRIAQSVHIPIIQVDVNSERTVVSGNVPTVDLNVHLDRLEESVSMPTTAVDVEHQGVFHNAQEEREIYGKCTDLIE
ncbi:hypothetical protein BSL78_02508 [Apostichopus japonicus]|uniref:Uncharacterized protein n=1 Tax=Stichopus japonicus TaxID=307972 RepID=A0A2G8LK27_STIJA|nr:hypothetical protein BSL78_02508 [Apostichopus japonicus]